jgi:hypothetical protein
LDASSRCYRLAEVASASRVLRLSKPALLGIIIADPEVELADAGSIDIR